MQYFIIKNESPVIITKLPKTLVIKLVRTIINLEQPKLHTLKTNTTTRIYFM